MQTEKLHWDRLVELGQALVGRQLRSRNDEITATITDIIMFAGPDSTGKDYNGLSVNVTLDPGQDGLKYWPSDKLNLFADVDTDDLNWELVGEEYTDDEGELTGAGERYVENAKIRRLEHELGMANEAVASLRKQRRDVRTNLTKAISRNVVGSLTNEQLYMVLNDALTELGGGYPPNPAHVRPPASETGTHH